MKRPKIKIKQMTVAISDSGARLVFSKEKVKKVLRSVENELFYGSKPSKNVTPGIVKYA